jgi:LacI family gluconate utilization system Gnt-I transcriptional repressor
VRTGAQRCGTEAEARGDLHRQRRHRVGIRLECRRLGITIPDDIAVAGFDNTALSGIMEPPLTTVQVPRREIGDIAAKVLLQRLQGDGTAKREHDLGFEIIKRRSA